MKVTEAAVAHGQSLDLAVTEIFHSIQGESAWAGWPCTFVRLTGCGLRCVWCDTAYAFFGSTRLRVPEIVAAVGKSALDWVEITGGEPLEQEGFYPLATELLDRGYRLLVETGGHLPIERIDPRAIKIVDLKAPRSHMDQRNRWENLAALGERDELKIVVADMDDIEWGLSKVREHDLDTRFTVTFSPVWQGLEPAALADKLLASRLRVRLGLQIHKILWGEARGR